MYSYLGLSLSFVDRDTLMRFLGNGIGHKNQTKSADKGKGANSLKAPKPHSAVQLDRRQGMPPRRHKIHDAEVMDDSEDSNEDSDSASDEDSDDTDEDSDDLDGCF